MSEFDRLYHYTDVDSARDILREGVIRAKTQAVYRDLVPDAGRSRKIGPIVWLTINPALDGVVAVKLRTVGRPLDGGLARIVLPYLCDTGLVDYCEAQGIDYAWFGPLVQTGRMCGSDYTCWRLCERDIDRTEWIGVEWLTSLDPMVWSPLEPH